MKTVGVQDVISAILNISGTSGLTLLFDVHGMEVLESTAGRTMVMAEVHVVSNLDPEAQLKILEAARDQVASIVAARKKAT